MKPLSLGTHVIGTDNKDIYYGIITGQPAGVYYSGTRYYIRTPNSTGIYWINGESTVPLSMFVPDLVTLLGYLPGKPVKGPVLFYTPDGPKVGCCVNEHGTVQYILEVTEVKIIYDEIVPDYVFPMQGVINRQLKPFIDQLKG